MHRTASFIHNLLVNSCLELKIRFLLRTPYIPQCILHPMYHFSHYLVLTSIFIFGLFVVHFNVLYSCSYSMSPEVSE